jgi:hypothetical protein
MPGYKARMLEEYSQLTVRINKLTDFLSTNAFNTLALEDRILLVQQFGFMKSYSNVLSERIARA